MSSNTADVTLSERLNGRVKWFNNKSGYGFITVTDGAQSGTDIFTHHSSINVDNQQYKYLVQGEYVQFSLVKTTSGNYEWQSSQVSGINGGKLMCETRREFKIARTTYKTEKPEPSMPRQQSAPSDTSASFRQTRDTSSPRQPSAAPFRQQSSPRARGEGPREGEKKEWTLVNQTNTRTPRQSSTNTSK